MPAATTRFETANATKYLRQLCKHFAHKIAVEEDGNVGRFAMPAGPARAEADATGLTLRAEATDADNLARAKSVLEDHLLRFAFREEPGPLTWKDVAA